MSDQEARSAAPIRLVLEGPDVYRRVEIPRDANEVTLHVCDYSVQVIVDGKAVRDAD